MDGSARHGVAAADCQPTLRSARFGGAGRVDLEHPVDLWPFRLLADQDFQLGSGRHRFVAGRLQRADMQERVTRAVAEFDEAEALVAA